MPSPVAMFVGTWLTNFSRRLTGPTRLTRRTFCESVNKNSPMRMPKEFYHHRGGFPLPSRPWPTAAAGARRYIPERPACNHRPGHLGAPPVSTFDDQPFTDDSTAIADLRARERRGDVTLAGTVVACLWSALAGFLLGLFTFAAIHP